MAITPLTAPWKMFTFDGVTSGSLGVAILGDGAFNAPERDVEMVAIPGRNGDYILDKGRYMNIEVTYPCTLVADSVADFPQAMADLRSLLCSRTTYCRLEDDYNPNEYRMAMYKSGLEVDPMVLKAGTFDITFECKPQRFLKSGETAVSITSGDTITNPTPFEARPLLQVYGEGSFTIGNGTFSLFPVPIGDMVAGGGYSDADDDSNLLVRSKVPKIDTYANNGDAITISKAVYVETIYCGSGVESVSATASGDASVVATKRGSSVVIEATLLDAKYSALTSSDNDTTISYSYVRNGTTTTGTIVFSVRYSVISGESWAMIFATTTTSAKHIMKGNIYQIWLDSSKPITILHHANIDLDIGEAYLEVDDEIVPINDAVSPPAVLPTLPSGATEITYDNTITQLDIVPRWWQV